MTQETRMKISENLEQGNPKKLERSPKYPENPDFNISKRKKMSINWRDAVDEKNCDSQKSQQFYIFIYGAKTRIKNSRIFVIKF